MNDKSCIIKLHGLGRAQESLYQNHFNYNSIDYNVTGYFCLAMRPEDIYTCLLFLKDGAFCNYLLFEISIMRHVGHAISNFSNLYL